MEDPDRYQALLTLVCAVMSFETRYETSRSTRQNALVPEVQVGFPDKNKWLLDLLVETHLHRTFSWRGIRVREEEDAYINVRVIGT